MNGHHNKYVGWDSTISGNSNYASLWKPDTLATIQRTITSLLDGVHPTGRPIVVPVDTITHVLSQCYTHHSPRVGDMYSRNIDPSIERKRHDTRQIVDTCISIIVSSVKDEYETTRNNNQLTVWTTVYGDFNPHGLRAHPPIKLRRKRPTAMQFNMTY